MVPSPRKDQLAACIDVAQEVARLSQNQLDTWEPPSHLGKNNSLIASYVDDDQEQPLYFNN